MGSHLDCGDLEGALELGVEDGGKNRPSLTEANYGDMVSTAATGPSGWQ